MNDCIGGLLILFLVLELCLAAAVTGADLSATSFGSNDFTVVRVGDSAVVSCLLRLPREDLATCPVWTHFPPSYHRFSNTERELNRCDEVYDERVTVQTNTTVSILNVTSIKPEDAGRYECQDDDQLGSSKEIIVISENPKCSSRTPEDSHTNNGKLETRQSWSKLELHCKVEFNGTLNATGQCILEWRIVGRDNVLDSKCIVEDNSVESTLTLDAVSHSNEANDTSYVCVVRGSAIEQYSCQTDQIERPSPEYNEDAVTIQPGPITSSPNLKIEPSLYDILQTQFRNQSLMDLKLHRLQKQTFCKVSELVKTQQDLLSVERKRLSLEKWKVLQRMQ